MVLRNKLDLASKHLWLIPFVIVVFAFDHISMNAISGTFYQDISDFPGEESSTIEFQNHFHQCSIKSLCMYVVKDRKNNQVKSYERESELPADRRLLQIWMKKPPLKYGFKVIAEKLTWQNARQRCMEFFGDLASIKSKQDEDEIKSLISGFSYDEGFWFGLNDIEKEGTYVWSDGSSLTYINWRSGEPSGNRYDNCMISGGPMTWVDAHCGAPAYFVCYVPTF